MIGRRISHYIVEVASERGDPLLAGLLEDARFDELRTFGTAAAR